MAMLLIQSKTPGLLTVNGQFCGRVDESAQTFMTHRDERIYLSFSPFDSAYLPLTRELQLSNDTPSAPAEGLYALVWPEHICQLELQPLPVQGPSTACESVLPPSMRDVAQRPLSAGASLLTAHTQSGDFAAVLDDQGRILDTLEARRLTWDTPEIVQALEDSGDLVGHGTLTAYRLTSEGFSLLSRQNVWVSGAPRWPATPLQTLRAYLEALCVGAHEEALAYLSTRQAHRPPDAFSRVLPLQFPLTGAPERFPLALGVLRVLSPTLAHVQAVCARARAQQSAQGNYKLEEILLYA